MHREEGLNIFASFSPKKRSMSRISSSKKSYSKSSRKRGSKVSKLISSYARNKTKAKPFSVSRNNLASLKLSNLSPTQSVRNFPKRGSNMKFKTKRPMMLSDGFKRAPKGALGHTQKFKNKLSKPFSR